MAWGELPPTFMGTTSSFGQQLQQSTSHTMSNMHFGDMNSQIPAPPPPPVPSSTSADVLAAATTLLHNSSNGRSHSSGNEALFGHHDISVSQPLKLDTNNRVGSQSLSQFNPAAASLERQSNDEDFMHDPFYTDMVFGSALSNPPRPRPVSQKVDIRWGSDAGFGTPQGFIAPTSQAKIEASERSHIQAMDAFLEVLQVPSSAENTRPSTPAAPQAFIPPPRNKNKSSNQAVGQNGEDESERPRKRRRSKHDGDENSDDEPSSSQKGPRKRKSTH